MKAGANTTMNIHPAYIKAKSGQCIEVTELASLIRSALKRSFQDTRFGVRSRSYAGGCSVDVTWTDGPSVREVSKVAGQFETRSFDGMIDLAHGNTLWLMPDGSACCAHDAGTEGSGGTHRAIDNPPPHPLAIHVRNVASAYVITHRTVSEGFVAGIVATLAAHYAAAVDAVAIAKDYLNGNAYNQFPPWVVDPWSSEDRWDCTINRALNGQF